MFTFTRDKLLLMFGLCLVLGSSGSLYVSGKLPAYPCPDLPTGSSLHAARI